MAFTNIDIQLINKKIFDIRNQLEKKYESMMGKCIEATDILVEQLNKLDGIKAEAKQVWCLYEYFENCSSYCYEEHWIAVVKKGKDKLYIDLTMDQFSWAFLREIPKIYISSKLPNFYLTRKPGKTTLNKCGWTDWYNTGNYINNFNYYN